MTPINCTPHPVVIFSQDGKTVLLTIPPHGGAPLRVKTPPQEPLWPLVVGGVEIPVVAPQDFSGGEVTGLPQIGEAPHQALIVGIVGAEAFARAWPGEVYATDTGPTSVVRRAEDLYSFLEGGQESVSTNLPSDRESRKIGSKGDILGVRRLQLIPRPRW